MKIFYLRIKDIADLVLKEHNSSLKVVAEGVEAEAQLSKLSQFGCDCVQSDETCEMLAAFLEAGGMRSM